MNKPPEPPTVKMTTAPDWAITLANAIQDVRAELRQVRTEQTSMREDICGHLHKLEERTKHNEAGLTTITGAHHAFTAETAEKLSSHSLRVKAPSQHDMELQAKLAEEISDRKNRDEQLDTKFDSLAKSLKSNNEMTAEIKKSVGSYFSRNPDKIGLILGAVVGLVLAALGAATAWIQKPPAPPPTVYVTPAPAPSIHPAVQP